MQPLFGEPDTWRKEMLGVVTAVLGTGLWVISTDVEAGVMEQRAEQQHQLRLAADAKPEEPDDLPEPEYEALSSEARATFEECRARYRQGLRAWQSRRQMLEEEHGRRLQQAPRASPSATATFQSPRTRQGPWP